MTNKKLLQKALDALSMYLRAGHGNSTDFEKQGIAYDMAIECVADIGAAIAQPAEPVAWRVRRLDTPNYWIIFLHYPVDAMNDPEREVQPLYIMQPAEPVRGDTLPPKEPS